jgi:hypothetical protein
MTPTEVKKAADEMVDMFTKIIWESGNTVSKPMIIDVCIAHCKRVIEVLEMLRKPEYTTFVLKYGEFDKKGNVVSNAELMDGYELINHYRLILSELEGRVK